MFKTNKVNKSNYNSLYIIILLTAFLSLGIIQSLYAQSKTTDSIDFSQDWNLKINNQNKGVISLNDRQRISKGDIYVLSKKLPDNLDGLNTLFFESESISFTVSLDGEIIYDYGHDVHIPDTSPGDHVHFIALPENSSGKNLQIRIEILYNSASRMLSTIKIVNGYDMLIYYLHSRLFLTLICFFMFILALTCIICENYLLKRMYDNHCLRYLGLFTLFVAIWSLTQIKTTPLILGDSWSHSSIAYISLSLVPIPLGLFVKSRYHLDNKTHVNRITYFSIAIFFITTILNLTRLWDYTENVILVHFSLVLVSLYFGYATIRYASNIENESSRTLISFAVIFLIFSGLL